MVVSNATVKAEIMCVLKIVISNFSINSCRDISNLFAEICNCPIADAFKLSTTKHWYLICYGLASYYHQLFVKGLDNSFFYCHFVSQCFNRINQNEQVDLLVKYWSDT